eukprot:GILK01001176.1.p1 GENE.GILK01001176.1~~GILK01001176.1.p1  ORF type:complete len:229 (-),score=23.94 GILK01001176.1:150-836(-)
MLRLVVFCACLVLATALKGHGHHNHHGPHTSNDKHPIKWHKFFSTLRTKIDMNDLRSLESRMAEEAEALSQVNDYISQEGRFDGMSLMEVSSSAQSAAKMTTSKVHGFCEICILVMQLKQRATPHLCAGLNTNYYITCVEVLESLLRADKALVYWLRNGCIHLDRGGAEIVRPCPAHSICAWVPNLFAQPPSMNPGGVEPLCPKDYKYLPRIPKAMNVPSVSGAPPGK